MNSTSQKIAIAVGAAIVGGALVYVVMTQHPTMPKDTPIVIVGGSIHHDVDKNDDTGWLSQARGVSYLGIVHRDSTNKTGIDNLAFNLFVDANHNPVTAPIQNTNGWAVKVTDATGAAAVNLCSDRSCSASSDLTGSARCNDGFSANSPVFASVVDNNKSRLQEKKNGNIINELRYHNKNGDCDGQGDNEGKCDMITTMRVDTCSPLQSQTLTCAGAGCTLTIGTK